MDWAIIVNAATAALLGGGIFALVRLSNRVARMDGTVEQLDRRLGEHNGVHVTLDERLSQLEAVAMRPAR